MTFEEIERRYLELIRDFQAAPDAEACMDVLRRRDQLNADMTPMDLCYVRHDMNVNDPFYAAEKAYYDGIGPRISDLSCQLDRLIVTSPFRAELEKTTGRLATAMMEENLRGSDSRLIPLAMEENELLSRHNSLTSNAVVQWEGKPVKRNLMTAWAQSRDRETRRRAASAVSDSWQAQRGELESLYGQLVDNRSRQAKILGLNSYVELSYHRMFRIGYGPEEVGRFRDQVKRHLVPLLAELDEKRRERLGLDHLYSYDCGVSFPNGNPVPRGDTAACLEATREMYARLSPETTEFIGFMMDNGLYDVDIRDGKRGGGYMMTFEKYRAPFIFANFDGTSENAYIMCHEGGHAFQAWLKRDEDIRDRCSYTSEAAETHAMSMEFFLWPYMELFFGDRAEDYRRMHLERAIRLVARECLQDEFEQLVYEQPDMTPEARNRLWQRLEREYCPCDDHTGNPNLEQGCGWQRIPHVFQWPFYAIDYALAQVCALQYCQWMYQDRSAAWQSYLDFCRGTGTLTFPELVREAGLKDPFAEDTLSGLVDWLRRFL
ncbi:MAG: M3 family oligoendopeptidase [Candidatus Faecivicinus sp.]